MIIWSGFGFIVLILGFASLLLTEFISESITENEHYFQEHSWLMLAAMIAAAIMTYGFHRLLLLKKTTIAIDENTGRKVEVEKVHSLFFVPVKWWPLILIAFGIFMSLYSPDNPSPTNIEPDFVYILMDKDDKPFLDYEGNDLLRSTSCNYLFDNSGNIVPGKYECELITMRIPKGQFFVLGGINDKLENYTIIVRGQVTRHEEDRFAFEGSMANKVPVIIQFSSIKPTLESTDEFPEFSYQAGKHKINYKGIITGWFEETNQ